MKNGIKNNLFSPPTNKRSEKKTEVSPALRVRKNEMEKKKIFNIIMEKLRSSAKKKKKSKTFTKILLLCLQGV